MTTFTRRISLLLTLVLAFPGLAQAAAKSEIQIKAGFVLNFAKYIEWPGEADSSGAFTIGVYGDPELASMLTALASGKKLKGRTIEVKEATDVAGWKSVNILYVSQSAGDDVPKILVALQGTNVLTASDNPGFVENGGMMSLSREGTKVRLSINMLAATNAELKISGKLQQVAKIVHFDVDPSKL